MSELSKILICGVILNAHSRVSSMSDVLTLNDQDLFSIHLCEYYLAFILLLLKNYFIKNPKAAITLFVMWNVQFVIERKHLGNVSMKLFRKSISLNLVMVSISSGIDVSLLLLSLSSWRLGMALKCCTSKTLSLFPFEVFF